MTDNTSFFYYTCHCFLRMALVVPVPTIRTYKLWNINYAKITAS